MIVISGGRRSGKTTEAIKLAMEIGAIIIVDTGDRAKSLNENAKALFGTKDKIFYSVDEYKSLTGDKRKVIVDEIEMVLSSALNRSGEYVAITDTDAELKDIEKENEYEA